jgi:hypothetical protein
MLNYQRVSFGGLLYISMGNFSLGHDLRYRQHRPWRSSWKYEDPTTLKSMFFQVKHIYVYMLYVYIYVPLLYVKQHNDGWTIPMLQKKSFLVKSQCLGCIPPPAIPSNGCIDGCIRKWRKNHPVDYHEIRVDDRLINRWSLVFNLW